MLWYVKYIPTLKKKKTQLMTDKNKKPSMKPSERSRK